MTDTFNDPGTGGGDQLPIKDLIGDLLLVTVHEETQPIKTVHGDSTAIRADVAALDGSQKGTVWADSLIFQKKLKGQLRGSIGGKVIGRLELGEKQPGKNAPYQLAAASAEEKVVGQKYLAHVAAAAAKDEEPF